MKQALLVYWSGTGNTEAMANAVASGLEEGGAAVKILAVAKATKADIAQADLIALGCPSMGAEILEEDEMEPFVASLGTAELAGKPLVLFGSYDWGDGEWMRNWEARMGAAGATLLGPGLIVQLEPGSSDLATCKALGAKLAKASA